MANIRQIRTRIQSVKNIEHITRAMKMVASARLHRAQTQLLEARPYAFKMREMVRDIAGHTSGETHPLLQAPKTPATALLVVTSDKGLCGGFNARVLQSVGQSLRGQEPAQHPEIIAVGRKSLGFFRRTGLKVFREWSGFWQDLAWTHADAMGQDIIDAYVAGRWSRVDLVYNRFRSIMSQELVRETLLPLTLAGQSTAQPQAGFGEHEFEPSADAIFDFLLPRAVKNSLWHILLESKAAELAARMQAMESASKSAREMISGLTLQMNRARQAAITREIAELVGAAEAING